MGAGDGGVGGWGPGTTLATYGRSGIRKNSVALYLLSPRGLGNYNRGRSVSPPPAALPQCADSFRSLSSPFCSAAFEASAATFTAEKTDRGVTVKIDGQLFTEYSDPIGRQADPAGRSSGRPGNR